MVPNLTKISLKIILVRIMGVMITYQALLIVNIIRSDFEPKKGKVARTYIWAESNFSESPLDTNVHELMKLVSAIR